MAFVDLLDLLNNKGIYPKGTSERYKFLDGLSRALTGAIFADALNFSFDQEEDASHKYIKLKDRRPAFVYNLPKIIVDHTSSLTFGEAHAPSVRVALEEEDPAAVSKQHKTLERLIEEIELDSVCMEAMKMGSIGSVAIVMYALEDGMPWFDLIDGKYCTPFFDPRDPRKLIRLERVYSVTIDELEQAGYDPADFDPDEEPYWIRIMYTAAGEVRSHPMPQKRYQKLGEAEDNDPTKKIWWVQDEERSFSNPFSFMNVVWLRNFGERKGIDGKSSFVEAVDFMIDISYLLSQISRGYRYAADPTIVVQRGELNAIAPVGGFSGSEQSQAAGSVPIQKTPSRALQSPPGGDIHLLEITGQGLHNAGEHVRLLREYALEVISGMKADQQHHGGVPQSGRALEILHKALIWLVEKFRYSYGTKGYLVLLRMVLRGLAEGTLAIDAVDTSELDPNGSYRLVWPQWETPTGQDLLATMQALEMAAGGSTQVPVPIVPLEYVAQKAAAAAGIADANRSAAVLLSEHGDKQLPLDLANQDMENQTKVANHPPTKSAT